MSVEKFKGCTALVTGASSGIGAECARQLAAAGANLVLVARRTERMERLQQELQQQCSIQVTVIGMDLAEADAAQRLFEQTEAAGLVIDVLINNAGYGKQGDFLTTPAATHANMLNLNIRTLTELSHWYGKGMQQRGKGYILLIGSIAAFLPVPKLAAYGASKAYVRSFGQALHREMRGTGVHVTVLNPGGTLTEFIEVAGQQWSKTEEKLFFMQADTVAEIGLKALASNRSSVVAGHANSLGMFMLRFIPRDWQSLIAKNVFH